MSTTPHYDVIISGAGPDGGALAYKLAPSWKNILLLERSGYLRRFEAEGVAEMSFPARMDRAPLFPLLP